jgi:hypothetical protein
MAPHLILKAWWSMTGTDVALRGTPESAISAIEARYSLSIPHDFRQYLKESSPVGENWDDEDGNWWPVERLQNIPDGYEYPINNPAVAQNASKHLIFLDYMMWSWA